MDAQRPQVVIPGGGHAVHFDEPERLNAALMAFLRYVNQPAPPLEP
jgi:pimeloyl-ACP methyl ester carboxylesterase